MRAAAKGARSIQAPAERHSTDEIVAEIMKTVKCPPGETAKHIEVYVRKLIDDLCVKPPPFTGSRRDNTEYLKDLRKEADKFRKMLGKAPKPLAAALFAPERFGPLHALHGTALGINPMTRDYLAQEPARLAYVNSELDRICAQCDYLLRHRFGKHGAIETQQRHAAIASRTILEAVASLTGAEPPALSCSPTSDFCEVARLFLEATTGEHGKSLQRACEAVAGDPYATPFSTPNG
jgi:hypothetical protein